MGLVSGGGSVTAAASLLLFLVFGSVVDAYVDYTQCHLDRLVKLNGLIDMPLETVNSSFTFRGYSYRPTMPDACPLVNGQNMYRCLLQGLCARDMTLTIFDPEQRIGSGDSSIFDAVENGFPGFYDMCAKNDVAGQNWEEFYKQPYCAIAKQDPRSQVYFMISSGGPDIDSPLPFGTNQSLAAQLLRVREKAKTTCMSAPQFFITRPTNFETLYGIPESLVSNAFDSEMQYGQLTTVIGNDTFIALFGIDAFGPTILFNTSRPYTEQLENTSFYSKYFTFNLGSQDYLAPPGFGSIPVLQSSMRPGFFIPPPKDGVYEPVRMCMTQRGYANASSPNLLSIANLTAGGNLCNRDSDCWEPGTVSQPTVCAENNARYCARCQPRQPFDGNSVCVCDATQFATLTPAPQLVRPTQAEMDAYQQSQIAMQNYFAGLATNPARKVYKNYKFASMAPEGFQAYQLTPLGQYSFLFYYPHSSNDLKTAPSASYFAGSGPLGIAGSYLCGCDTLEHSRITIESGTLLCVDDRDECSDGTNTCGPNSVCINRQGGYDCECMAGYAYAMRPFVRTVRDSSDLFNASNIYSNETTGCIPIDITMKTSTSRIEIVMPRFQEDTLIRVTLSAMSSLFDSTPTLLDDFPQLEVLHGGLTADTLTVVPNMTSEQSIPNGLYLVRLERVVLSASFGGNLNALLSTDVAGLASSVPPFVFERMVQLKCGCENATFAFAPWNDGSPKNLTVTQNWGTMYFAFNDDSVCEQAFSVIRYISPNGTDFDPDTTIAANFTQFAEPSDFESEGCGAHVPFPIVDDLSRVAEIGDIAHYCVQAFADASPSVPSYRSSRSCITARFHFESRLNIQVINQITKVPVSGAVVSWTSPYVIPGSMVTGDDGAIVIQLNSSNLASELLPLSITVSKVTPPDDPQEPDVIHRFTCPSAVPHSGIFCENVPLLLAPFTDEYLTVSEVTPVRVAGHVYMDKTESAAKPFGCGLPGARVCMRTTTNEEQCTDTDANGFYIMDGKVNSRVSLTVSLPSAQRRGNTNTTFIRKPHPSLNETEELFFLRPTKSYSNIDFVDVGSVETLYVHVAGGMCLTEFLQQLQVQFLVCENNLQNLPLTKLENNIFMGTVPAAVLANLKITGLSAIGATTTQNSEILATFANFAETIDLSQLSEGNATSDAGMAQRMVHFAYFPVPQLSVEFFDFGSSTAGSPAGDPSDDNSWAVPTFRPTPACSSNLPFGCQAFLDPTNGAQVDDLPLTVFGAQVRFSSAFPNGKTCPVISDDDGTVMVKVEDALSDSLPGLPNLCSPSCDLPVEYSQALNSSVVRYLFRVQPLATPPYLRTLTASLGTSSAKYCFRIIGEVEVSNSADSMVIPLVPEKPLLVLRDPPGSKSFQYARNMETRATVRVGLSNAEQMIMSKIVKGGDAAAVSPFGNNDAAQDINHARRTYDVSKPIKSFIQKKLPRFTDFIRRMRNRLAAVATQIRGAKVAQQNRVRSGKKAAKLGRVGSLIKMISQFGGSELCIGGGFFASVKGCLGLFSAGGGSSSSQMIHEPDRLPGVPESMELEGNGAYSDFELRWSMQTDRNEGLPGDHMYMFLMSEVVVSTTKIVKANGQCAAQLVSGVGYYTRPMTKGLPGLDWDKKGFLWVSRRHLFENTIPLLDQVISSREIISTDRDLANKTLNSLLAAVTETDDYDEVALKKDTDTRKSFYVLPSGLLEDARVTVGKQTIDDMAAVPNTFFTLGKDPFTTFPGIPAQDNLENRVKKSNFISFYGGGGVLEYGFEAERFHDSEVFNGEETTSQSGRGFSSTVDLTVPFFEYREETFSSPTKLLTVEIETSTEIKQTSEVGFALADSSVGDAFNIQVYMDMRYRTFGFKTLFGRSTCPHEANTDFREKPILYFPQLNLTEMHPGEPAELYAEVRNLGDDPAIFELYTDPAFLRGNDVKVLINGKNIVGWPMTFEEILPKQQVPIKVQILQGQTLSDSLPDVNVLLGLRSKCEASLFNPLLKGPRVTKTRRQSPFARSGDAVTDEQSIFVRFLRHCPRVEWAGEFAKPDSAIVVRSEPEGSQTVLVAVRNRGSSSWSKLPQVLSVGIQYRIRSATTQTVSDWTFVKSGISQVNMVPLESNQTHYAAYSWDVSSIQDDGIVEVRIYVDCTKPTARSGLDNEPGIVNAVTDIKSFRIDRTRPRLFSSVPLDGGKLPLGQPISMDFTETLQCDSIVAQLTIASLSEVLQSGQELMLLCKANQLQIQMDRMRVMLRRYAGLQARLVVSNIMDVAGNLLNAGGSNSTGAIDLLLEFDQAAGKDYSIKGLLLDNIADVGNGIYIPGTPSFTQVVQNITDAVAQLLQITIDRIKVESFVFVAASRVRVDLFVYTTSSSSNAPATGRRLLSNADQDLGLLLDALVANQTLRLDPNTGSYDVSATSSSPNGVSSNGEITLSVDSNAKVVLDKVSGFQVEVNSALKRSFEQSETEFNRVQQALEQGVDNILEQLQSVLDSFSGKSSSSMGRRRLLGAEVASVSTEVPSSVPSLSLVMIGAVFVFVIGLVVGRLVK